LPSPARKTKLLYRSASCKLALQLFVGQDFNLPARASDKLVFFDNSLYKYRKPMISVYKGRKDIMRLWDGKTLGRYRVIEQIGRGGTAVVYKAYDAHLERKVAIKVFRKEDFLPAEAEQLLKRFDREAKVLARLTHPNIVPIIDYGEYEGTLYLVMPFLSGGTLKRREGGMEWREALRLVLPIADALAYAHKHHILHRDVKPSNILLTETGQPMLSDFGIARLLESEAGFTMTGTGIAVGTPGYMAPEQRIGKADERSDLYSLGVVLYELITGHKPFEAEQPLDVRQQQMTGMPAKLRQLAGNMPPELERVLFKALEQRSENRYPDMQTFTRALRSLLESPTQKTPEETITRFPPLQEDNVTVKLPQHAGQARAVKTVDASADAPPKRRRTDKLVWVLTLGVAGLIVLALAGWWLVEKIVQQPTFIAQTMTAIFQEEQVKLTATHYATVLAQTAAIAGQLGQEQATTETQLTQTLTIEAQAERATTTPETQWTQTPTTQQTLPTVVETVPPPIRIREIDGMEMVYVPAGIFLMGSSESEIDNIFVKSCKNAVSTCSREWFADETPQHGVFLDHYWIDRTEVTNGMYAECVQKGVCTPPVSMNSYTHISYYGNTQYENYPVIYVNWEQARRYCEWVGAKLPSEAEWEKAARGTDGQQYSWGNNFDCRKGNFDDGAEDGDPYTVTGGPNCDGYVDTAPVGSYPEGASPYNALDMLGNVWEWVADWYAQDYYMQMVQTNPIGPVSGEERVMRGGSWSSFEHNVRTPFRFKDKPDNVNYNLGFRCALSP
jgi:serine/threonine protein kinase/formylglycine-generating enzyme required for sulfatase activity